MFIEPHFSKKNDNKDSRTGWIEVICGSMFSGKTEELIRRLNRALIARQRVEIFKPSIDTRYHVEDVVSHNENAIRSTPVQFANDILLLAGDSDIVGIDEAQFFDDNLVEVCNQLANDNKRVIIAGLDMDFNGKPFGPMPALMAIAEFITKVHAICVQCGSVASFSYRIAKANSTILLGEKQEYEARCRRCFSQAKSSESIPE